MIKGATVLFLLIAALASMGGSDLPLFPFALSAEGEGSVTDVSEWIESPAGKHGFLRCEGEHFVHDAGVIRLNGINLTGPANFPSHDEADRLALRFSHLGFNCVRLHLFDCVTYSNAFQRASPCLFRNDPTTTSRIDERQRDRQDYLIAALKRRGIYVDVNLHAAQTFDARDGFPTNLPMNRGYNLWKPEMIRAERAYWTDWLTHENPHTGLRPVDDPAVALVEITNENGLFSVWGAGKMKELPSGTNGVAVVDALEKRYWQKTKSFLRNLGVKVPIIGTQLGYSTPFRLSELDAIDIHIYYAHPHGALPNGWSAVNEALVNTPGYDIRDAASARIADRPFLTSETSTPYPNFYGADHQPIVRAYAALQDWAGVFTYSWNNSTNAFPSRHEYFFYNVMRPEVLAHLPAAAAMFLKGEVSVARDRVNVGLTEKDYFDAYAKTGFKAVPVATCARATGGRFDNDEALVRGVGLDLTGAAVLVRPLSSDKTSEWARGVRRSDTGEIVWDRSVTNAGVFTVVTPSVKFFSGFAAGRTVRLGDVTLEPASNRLGWCAVSLLDRDGRILLAATGLTHNGGVRFASGLRNTIHAYGADFGSDPVVTEGVKVRVTLPDKTGHARCFALDERGLRKVEVPVERTDDGRTWVETDARYRTVWYEIDVRGRL